MANPRTLRESLATRLRSIAGIQVYDSWPSAGLNVPCAVIDDPEAEPEQTFGRGELTQWRVPVWLFVSLAPGPEQAADNLAPLLATSSTGGIFGAVDADRRLGGAVDTTLVRRYRDHGEINVAEGAAYYGAVVDLELWAT